MDIKNFKYNEAGLNRFFGPLEARIMEILWDGKERSIKEVQHELNKETPLNFNTVMKRLTDKGVLAERTQGRLSLFTPTQSRDAFIEEQSKKLTENLLDEFGNVVINHMIDSIKEVDLELLEKLEQKMRQLKGPKR